MLYNAPTDDYQFIFKHILPLADILKTEKFAHCDTESFFEMIHQAGKFASNILQPAYWECETTPPQCENNTVITPDIMKTLYHEFCAGGYGAICSPEQYGGMNLPYSLFTVIFEMISAAHMGFGLCPLLSQGAIHALEIWGTHAQKQTYLPPLISGKWTGTMNLTEPQAGSSVGDITTKAVYDSSSETYKITGTKIYITFGDHDLSENIIHLVLARLPNAPAGTKGISLFLVPKFLVNPDGTLGERNSVYPVGIEEKLGIHSSPTCTMQFDNATGYLIGTENAGMRAMFTMMNDARLQVASQGVGVSEIAFQKALTFAKDRTQGTKIINDTKNADKSLLKQNVPIIQHQDIQRQLMDIRVKNYIARLIVLKTSYHTDCAAAFTDADSKIFHQAYADFMTPIAKIFATDGGVQNTSDAIQIFGGMGYITETQIACHLQDSRIAPIYEGTNGIQAIDFITRKLGRDQMQIFRDLCDKIAYLSGECLNHEHDALVNMGDILEIAGEDLLQAGEWMYQKWWLLDQGAEALSGAKPFMQLCGIVTGGYLAILGAYNAINSGDISDEYQDYIHYATYYADNVLSTAKTLSIACTRGTDSLRATQKWID